MIKSLRLKTAAALVALAGTSGLALADNPMVGGAEMFPTMNIVENAANSADHTTLVAAVQAAGLVDTLAGEGPFTVFAPVDDAFAALPEGTVEGLLMPENMEMLTKVLTAHVVPGNLTGTDLMAQLEAGGGRTVLRTVSGDMLAVEMRGDTVYIIDENAGGAAVTISDVMQSNGVIHVIDSVLLPM